MNPQHLVRLNLALVEHGVLMSEGICVYCSRSVPCPTLLQVVRRAIKVATVLFYEGTLQSERLALLVKLLQDTSTVCAESNASMYAIKNMPLAQMKEMSERLS